MYMTTTFKDILLLKPLTNQCEISCGAFFGKGKESIFIYGPGHITKMAGTPIYDKNLQSLLLHNQKPYDLET